MTSLKMKNHWLIFNDMILTFGTSIVLSQTCLHIHAVWPGSILLAVPFLYFYIEIPSTLNEQQPDYSIIHHFKWPVSN
jgi:hypothetical protein